MTLQDLFIAINGQDTTIIIAYDFGEKNIIETNAVYYLNDLDQATLNCIVWRIHAIARDYFKVYIK